MEVIKISDWPNNFIEIKKDIKELKNNTFFITITLFNINLIFRRTIKATQTKGIHEIGAAYFGIFNKSTFSYFKMLKESKIMSFLKT